MCCDSRVSDDQPEHLRDIAERLVSEASDFVRGRREEIIGAGSAGAAHPDVRTKSSRTDPVTLADTEAEQLLRERLARLRPADAVLGEEGGGAPGGGAVRWVVDPIDGTVNFLYAIPAYAVSVAAQVGGVSVAGAVADVAGGRIYSAAVGRGAELLVGRDRVPLRCSAAEDLSMALVSTGFGYAPRRRAAQAAVLAQLLPVVRDIRRIGSAALDLCMVAAGCLDAHYEHGLNEWDWAAGALIAAEAGAVVVLPDVQDPGAGLLVAAAPGVASQLIAELDRISALGPLP